MKNFNKILAAVLALAMIVVFAGAASAANISKDDAKAAALEAVNAAYGTNYTVDDVVFEYVPRAEYEDDYRKTIYEVNFYVEREDGFYDEYDCDIDAETGELVGRIEYDVERNPDDVPGQSGNVLSGFRQIIEFFINLIKSLFGLA